VQLTDQQRIFIGFKMNGSLRHQLGALEGPDVQYVSHEEGAFLTICFHNKDQYVGKIVDGRLTTDHVDDVRRNVISILSRLCPEFRMPENLDIWVCASPVGGSPAADLIDTGLD